MVKKLEGSTEGWSISPLFINDEQIKKNSGVLRSAIQFQVRVVHVAIVETNVVLIYVHSFFSWKDQTQTTTLTGSIRSLLILVELSDPNYPNTTLQYPLKAALLAP